MAIQAKFECQLESSKRLNFPYDKEIIVEKGVDHHTSRPVERLLNLCWWRSLQANIDNTGVMVSKRHSARDTSVNYAEVVEPGVWGQSNLKRL